MSSQQKLERRANYFRRYLDAKGFTQIPAEVLDPVAEAYARLVTFFAKEPDMRQPKGVLIFGGTGTGKTTLIKAAKDCCRVHMAKQPEADGIVLLRARRMAEDFSTFPDYTYWLHRQFGQKAVAIDDLGSERFGKRFGMEWGLEDYLEDRYETWTTSGHPTWLTSNLLRPEDFLERYGNRAYSRLSEMVEFVLYSGQDRRFPANTP
jgi:DNA replication protein DnaC